MKIDDIFRVFDLSTLRDPLDHETPPSAENQESLFSEEELKDIREPSPELQQ